MSPTDLSMAMPMSIDAPKGRILCVDDEPNILRALCWLLQREFEVVTAASGREGLDLVRSDDFDVIISDQRMPEMSGIDFLKEAKAIAPRALRILLTGYSDLDAVLRSVNESEIFRYVTKPWNVMELPRIVAQAAEIARSQPAAPDRAETPSGAFLPVADEARILVLDDDIQIHAAVELCAGDLARVVHVTNIADTIHHLQNTGIGVLVSETSVGSVDMTRLLCILKQRHPQIASVVLTGQAGSDTVAKLVNQGQIFRLIPKPIKAIQLRDTLRAALSRSYEIKCRPELGRRHEVDLLPEEELASFQADLQAAALSRATGEKSAAASLASRLGGILRRLFGGVGNHA
jgi:DNA-binding NtrC family response regulator